MHRSCTSLRAQGGVSARAMSKTKLLANGIKSRKFEKWARRCPKSKVICTGPKLSLGPKAQGGVSAKPLSKAKVLATRIKSRKFAWQINTPDPFQSQVYMDSPPQKWRAFREIHK